MSSIKGSLCSASTCHLFYCNTSISLRCIYLLLPTSHVFSHLVILVMPFPGCFPLSEQFFLPHPCGELCNFQQGQGHVARGSHVEGDPSNQRGSKQVRCKGFHGSLLVDRLYGCSVVYALCTRSNVSKWRPKHNSSPRPATVA